jgi:hypothetical protein
VFLSSVTWSEGRPFVGLEKTTRLGRQFVRQNLKARVMRLNACCSTTCGLLPGQQRVRARTQFTARMTKDLPLADFCRHAVRTELDSERGDRSRPDPKLPQLNERL